MVNEFFIGGYQFVADQLQRGIVAFNESTAFWGPAGAGSFTEVQRQLSKIAAQIGGDDGAESDDENGLNFFVFLKIC